MASEERDVQVDGVALRVREAGVADGDPVIHFHGTPGSRLEMAWADEVVSAAGVRMIAFDRPGYGASTPAPFSLGSVARMTLQVADQMGLERFRTTGWSGGGPFALATAATAPERVPAVGVIAGPGPFQLVPGALQELSEGDKAAERLLPGNPEGAAAGFAEGFAMTDALASAEALYKTFEPLLCEWDRTQWNGPGRPQALLADIREALKSGVWGCAWDNVAWIGAWDVDPTTVRCPVLLWYGSEDLMATPKHARWLDQNLPDARLVMREGEGHLLAFTHLAEMLRELLTYRSGLWWRTNRPDAITGASLLAINDRCLACMRRTAQDSYSAHALLYLAAVCAGEDRHATADHHDRERAEFAALQPGSQGRTACARLGHRRHRPGHRQPCRRHDPRADPAGAGVTRSARDS